MSGYARPLGGVALIVWVELPDRARDRACAARQAPRPHPSCPPFAVAARSRSRRATAGPVASGVRRQPGRDQRPDLRTRVLLEEMTCAGDHVVDLATERRREPPSGL